MKVSELGEFGLVELIGKTINAGHNEKIESWRNLLIGIGDDAAVWKCDGKIHLATTDSLVENVHFTTDIIDLAGLGWKSLAINLSDIAAMGGIPRYALVSLAIPPDTEVDDVLSFYRGMMELARKYGVAVIGGDTDGTPRIAITLTVLGEIEKPADLLRRSSAKSGDLIAVTGFLGTAAAGYKMLSQKLYFDIETASLLKDAFTRPEPRVDEGRLMVKAGIRTAIDVSDGLIGDMRQICKASKVGARLNLADVPIAPEVKSCFSENSLQIALSGGEDYELLFTGSQHDIESVIKQAKCPVTVIGEITADSPGEVLILDSRGKILDFQNQGWEHFRSKD